MNPRDRGPADHVELSFDWAPRLRSSVAVSLDERLRLMRHRTFDLTLTTCCEEGEEAKVGEIQGLHTSPYLNQRNTEVRNISEALAFSLHLNLKPLSTVTNCGISNLINYIQNSDPI